MVIIAMKCTLVVMRMMVNIVLEGLGVRRRNRPNAQKVLFFWPQAVALADAKSSCQ